MVLDMFRYEGVEVVVSYFPSDEFRSTFPNR